MSRARPTTLSESAPIHTNQKTIAWLCAVCFAFGAGWLALKMDLNAAIVKTSDHDRRFEVLEAKYQTDHELLIELKYDLKALLRDRKLPTENRPLEDRPITSIR